MAAFATIPELQAFMGEDFDAARADLAELALDLATGAIRNFTGQHIELVIDDTVTLDGTGRSVLFLPETPVTEVTSITVAGTALAYVSGNYEFTWTPAGMVGRRGVSWGTEPQSIVVVYSHGYATIPDDVRSVCLSVAARGMSNPLGLRSESVGSYSYSVAVPATGVPTGLSLNDAEQDMLRSYRVPVLA